MGEQPVRISGEPMVDYLASAKFAICSRYIVGRVDIAANYANVPGFGKRGQGGGVGVAFWENKNIVQHEDQERGKRGKRSGRKEGGVVAV